MLTNELESRAVGLAPEHAQAARLAIAEEGESPVPLGSGQVSMWAQSQTDPARGVYVEQIQIKFSQAPDSERIRKAWEVTVRNNAALRVCIGAGASGLPEARVLPSPPCQWVDEPDSFPGDPEGLLESDRARPFGSDLPPARCRYWASSGIWLWTFHHAILDGRCIQLVLDEFLQRVTGLGDDGQVRPFGAFLPNPDALEVVHDAWSNLKRGWDENDEAIPTLGGVKQRQGNPWNSSRLTLSASAVQALDEIAQRAETTVHCIVQWAWAFVIGRVFGRRNTVVGVVRSGHWSLANPDAAVGYLLSTVPVPATTDPAKTLGEVLTEYRKAVLEVRNSLVADPSLAAATMGRMASRPWDAVVMTERSTMEEAVIGRSPVGLVESLQLHERTGEPLSGAAWLGAEPAIEVESDPTHFSCEATRMLVNAWKEAIELIATVPLTVPLADLEPLPKAYLQRELQLESGGPPMAERGKTVWECFLKVVGQQPHAVAIQSETRQVTYGELHSAAESLALALHRGGVGVGDQVASRIDERRFAPMILLACARLGAVYMPFDRDLPAERVRQMFELASPVAIVQDSPLGDEHSDLFHIDPRAIPGQSGTLPPFEPFDPFLPLCLLFTSGSTGEPKGVLNHHYGILNEVLSVGELLSLQTSDRVLQFPSLGFDASLEDILGTMMAGAMLVPRDESVVEGFDRFHRFLEKFEITVADLPTAYWAAWSGWLAQRRQSPPEVLRAVIIGGEKASVVSTQAWIEATNGSVPVLNTYGPTEASIAATFSRLFLPETGEDPPIGRPMPGMTVRLMDALGRPAAPGVSGEIILGGVGVGLGYLDRPEATAKVFGFEPQNPERPAWYRTGDLGWRDESGLLHYVGRVDDQVKIRGKRIEPGEIRAVLESHPDVEQAYVGTRTLNENLTLVAWLVAPGHGDGEVFEHFLQRELPSWMVPSHLVILESLPLNERGKVARRELPDPQPKEIGDAKVTPLEKWLQTVFAEVLRVDRRQVDPDLDFAAQGGDSLSAMTLTSRLNQAGINFEPGELVADSSPRALARRIDEDYGKARTKWDPVIRLRLGDPERSPLVLIHPTPGDVLGYANLITELPSDIPCLGVVSRSLHLPHQPHYTIEEMAKSYIEELRPHLEGKRWILGGWCYGGVVAYEMARQLVENGEPAPLLLVIEGWAESPASSLRRWRLRLAKLEAFLRAGSSRRKAWLRGRLRKVAAEPVEPGHESGDISNRSAAWTTNTQAIDRYEPLPYEGKMELFLTVAEDSAKLPIKKGGWHVLGTKVGVNYHTGTHDRVLRPPFVSGLAAHLASIVNREEEVWKKQS